VLNAGRLVAVERAVQLRLRALRKIEMRFASPVTLADFARLPNIQNLCLEDNLLRCTVQGDTDALIKTASQFRVTDFISQQPSLEEAFQAYYGVGGYVAA
jgi:ABC-2 type transport system ATP-binding protein